MGNKTIEQRVQALEDIEAIRQLKARYLFCCDCKDPKGARSCFVDGPIHIDYGVIGTFDKGILSFSVGGQVTMANNLVPGEYQGVLTVIAQYN